MKTIKTQLRELNTFLTKTYPVGSQFFYHPQDAKNIEGRKCVACGSTGTIYKHYDSELTNHRDLLFEKTYSKAGVFICNLGGCDYAVTKFLELFTGIFGKNVMVFGKDGVLRKGWEIVGPFGPIDVKDGCKLLVKNSVVNQIVSISDLESWQIEDELLELKKNLAYLSVFVDSKTDKQRITKIICDELDFKNIYVPKFSEWS